MFDDFDAELEDAEREDLEARLARQECWQDDGRESLSAVLRNPSLAVW